MKLYLMQHALAMAAEESPERPLTAEGVDQAKAAARGLKKLGLSFDLIIASPERRAHQTAALIAEGVRYPHSDILTTEAVLANRQPQELLDLLHKEPAGSHILVIGHLPHLARLASTLMQGGQILISNAGITCIDLSAERTGLEFHMQAVQLAKQS